MNTDYQYTLDAEGNAVITRQLHPIQLPARGKEPIMRYENGRTIQNGVIYELNKDGTADVCGYRSFHWNVNILRSVNGCRVVRIREEAFAGCTQIQQVRIPEGVLEIRADAFRGCNQLAYLYLPESLSRIGKGAIPNYGVREITDYAQAAYEEELQIAWSRKMHGLYDPVTPRKTRVYIPNVYVPRGSYAEDYCKENKIHYSLEKKTELVREPIHKKPDASVDQVPEKHTAHQAAAVPDISQPMQKACSAEKKTELVREPIHQKNSIPCTPSKSAEPFKDKESGITYQLKPDGTAEVTYCSGWHSSKTIPETISGYRVTSIGANAFPEGSCRSLYIPASVTEIKSLPVDFTEKVWDRPRFDMRENAMDIDEPVLVVRTYSVYIYVKPNSYAESYCKDNKIRYMLK